jgi:hypothetical protein
MRNIARDPFGGRGYGMFADFDESYATKEFIAEAKSKREELSNMLGDFSKHSIIENAERYSMSDVKYNVSIVTNIIEKPENERKLFHGITCQIVKGDTLVLNTISNSFDGFGKSIIKIDETFKPAITYKEYLNKIKMHDHIQARIDKTIEKWQSDISYSQELAKLSDEVSKLNAEERRLYDIAIAKQRIIQQKEREEREQAVIFEETNRYIKLFDFDIDAPPKGQLLTKESGGVKYSYYLDKDGWEVKHGTYTRTLRYNNYEAHDNLSGYVVMNGSESLTITYMHGYEHGQLSYKANINVKRSRGNDYTINQTLSVNLWKGYPEGTFSITRDNTKYTITASKGIAKSILVQYPDRTRLLESEAEFKRDKSVKLESPKHDNGWENIKDFEFGAVVTMGTIKLPFICVNVE